ncbi:MAG: hypothetical protein ACK457_01635 [Flavobacteriia bacterium]
MRTRTLFIPLCLIFCLGCTTIYRIPAGRDSIYLLKRGQTIRKFDNPNGKKFSRGLSYGINTDLMPNNVIKIEKVANGFQYTIGKSEVFKLFPGDSSLYESDRIIPLIYSLSENTSCNGVEIYKTQKRIIYKYKYVGDSLVYFNNQPQTKVHLFNYYACTEDSDHSFIDPITISVDMTNGMIYSLDYFVYEENWLIDPNDSLPERLKATIGIVDFSKVFISKRKLRKVLM